MDIVVSNKLQIDSGSKYVEIPSGENSNRIILNPETMIMNAFHYGSDDYGNLLIGENLTNTDGIIDVNGVPTGVPSTNGIKLLMWDYQKYDWYNIKTYNVIFDLSDSYNLDYAYIYNSSHNLYLKGSKDGVDYVDLAPRFESHYQNEWIKVDFQGEARAGNRYFSVGMTYYDASLRGIILYGRPSGIKINKGIKMKRKIKDIPLHENMGSNGFYMEDPEMMSKICGTARFYVVPSWLLGKDFERPGQGKNKTPNDIKQRFTLADEGNVDQWLQGFRNAGVKSMMNINASPAFLRPVGTNKPELTKAVDPGYSTVNLLDTTDPMKYTFIARIAWNIAARYGANKDVDQQYIHLEDGEPIRVGLNILEVLEVGNEFDRWWDGAQCYHNPQEMAAYMSAIYDGHKGAMGPGFGVKNADPSMLVSMVSTASGDNISYIREMLLWFNKYRGENDFALDVLNWHWYNSTDGSQDASIGAAALQPEKGLLESTNRKWSDFRDEYCPSVQTWLTEFGYDEHLGGVFSPAYVTQFERSRYKAYWLMRSYFINQYTGVDRSIQYWYANHAGTKLSDFNDWESHPDKFVTAGLVDGIQSTSDYNRFPLMSYWYLANLKTHSMDYLFQHLIMRNGISNTEETIIDTTDSNVWAMAYNNYVTNTSQIYVWLDSAEFKHVDVTINVTESEVQLITMDEAEIRESLEGVVTVLPVINGKIRVKVNECPIIIRTTNIGAPKLIQPKNIEVQQLTEGGNLITWLDRNIVDVEVVIRRRNVITNVFQIIYQGEVKSSSYIDTAINNLGDYKVQIVKVGTPPIIDPDPEEGLWRTVFDNGYFANNSLTTASSIVTNGDEVSIIQDQIGNRDLLYSGIEVPQLTQSKPRYYNNLGGLIFFPNETGVNYSSTLSPTSTFPRERWFVATISNYQIFEAFFNTYYTEYLGDLSNSGLRTRNGSDGANDNTYMTPMPLPRNNTFIIRQVFTDDSTEVGRVNIELWLNGVKAPNNLTGNKVFPQHKLGIGADTNNSHFGLKGLFFKNGKMTNNEATIITNELKTMLNITSLTNNDLGVPYGQNLSIIKNGSIYTLQYQFKSVGSPEDLNNRKIRWIYIRNGITDSIYMSELDNSISFNTLDYPQYNIRELRVELTCQDILGRFFVVPQSVIISN